MRPEDHAYKALWAASLMQVAVNVRAYLRKHRLKRLPDPAGVAGEVGQDLRWLGGDSLRPGSFIWVCSVFELRPEWVRDQLCLPRMADSALLKRMEEFGDDDE